MGCACRHELPCAPSSGWRLPAQHVTGQCRVFFHPRAAFTVGGSMPTVQTPSGRNWAPPGLEPRCVVQGALVSCARSRATPPAPRVPAPQAVQTVSCPGLLPLACPSSLPAPQGWPSRARLLFLQPWSPCPQAGKTNYPFFLWHPARIVILKSRTHVCLA